jgi:hypothetical protein
MRGIYVYAVRLQGWINNKKLLQWWREPFDWLPADRNWDAKSIGVCGIFRLVNTCKKRRNDMSDHHHHRAGPLKQKNKTHKAGKHVSKNLLAKKSGGKVERVPIKPNKVFVLAGAKQQRLQKAKQWKQVKKEDVWMRHRLGTINMSLLSS